jgi:hypothetical protein
MVSWLFSRGLETLWLTTGPNTRAQGFYEAAGWQGTGMVSGGDVRMSSTQISLLPLGANQRGAEDGTCTSRICTR